MGFGDFLGDIAGVAGGVIGTAIGGMLGGDDESTASSTRTNTPMVWDDTSQALWDWYQSQFMNTASLNQGQTTDAAGNIIQATVPTSSTALTSDQLNTAASQSPMQQAIAADNAWTKLHAQEGLSALNKYNTAYSDAVNQLNNTYTTDLNNADSYARSRIDSLGRPTLSVNVGGQPQQLRSKGNMMLIDDELQYLNQKSGLAKDILTSGIDVASLENSVGKEGINAMLNYFNTYTPNKDYNDFLNMVAPMITAQNNLRYNQPSTTETGSYDSGTSAGEIAGDFADWYKIFDNLKNSSTNTTSDNTADYIPGYNYD